MNILERIIESKKIEVAQKKKSRSIDSLMESPWFNAKSVSLSQRIISSTDFGIIAEFKRKSPSKGEINTQAIPEEVANKYAKAGVSGISILTDTHYFGGDFFDFDSVRNAVDIPLLRKDFIVDEYQVYETKSIGADVILLIAANLSVDQSLFLAKKAKELGLEVLLELHTQEELVYVNDFVDIVGINNRNLKTFEVDLENSIRLANQLPDHFVRIAESGISDPNNIIMLKEHGFQGFLIGENFMKTNDPGQACHDFIQQLKGLDA